MNFSKKFNLRLHPDQIDQRFENFLRALKEKRDNRVKLYKPTERLAELSKPKKPVFDDFEDMLGPGRYNPKDKFLSTKTRTPSVKICQTNRFRTFRKKHNESLQIYPKKERITKSLNFSESMSPSFSFKRTGHNLKLVENIENPGVGRYTPDHAHNPKAYSFKRSEREFNWKKNIRSMYQAAEFEKRFWK